MRKKLLLLCVAFLAIPFVWSQEDNVLLSFDKIAERAGFSYVGFSSQSSDNPIEFAIENWDNRNMYRFFDNAPILGDYAGIEITFDYESIDEIDPGLQLFISTAGFKPGTYPFFTTELSDYFEEGTTKVVVKFEDFPVLYEGDIDPATTPFNRFGIRWDSEETGHKDEETDTFVDFPTVQVKLKSSYLIKSDDSREAFNYVGGGMYNAAHSYRLYGPKANFSLAVDGFVMWDLLDFVDEVKFINISLVDPLPAEALDLIFEYTESQDEIPADRITGLTEGSKFVSFDLTGLGAEVLTIFSEQSPVTLGIESIALSNSPEGGEANSLDNVFVDNDLPAIVNVYNITGQLVKKNVSRVSALENLANGIYIINNKKVIVRN